MGGEKKKRKLTALGKKAVPTGQGRSRRDASFPTTPSHADMPADYLSTLNEIKERIRS